ncbi:MAG: M20 family metallopeptidase [Verrucomicrobia bacterium]|nr:M20 family metallopeptidase [Verrucomicrobiota bacterium]
MTQPVKLLRELIALPSVNPAFLAGHDALTGERHVADFLAFTADRAGLEIEFQKVFPSRPNLLARLTPPGKITQRIVLAPHMDTVGGTPEQFKPVVKNGRLYGRGACDTKGSVAAMFSALLAVAAKKQRPKQTEIIFAALVDEENAQTGSRALAASGFKADLAIVGEPTRLQVVTAHKGDFWWKLETRGRAAHGATPHLGKNAVHKMARVVDALETEYAAELRKRPRHPLLGHATVNVGTITGGRQPNIVPDRCEISIDRRTLPGETEAGVRREITALLRRCGVDAIIADTRGAPCLPMETDKNLPLLKQFLRSTGQRRPIGVDFFCDASVLSNDAGIPSLVFGPGDIAQAHTADEWISIRSLERGTAMLTKFLQSLP